MNDKTLNHRDTEAQRKNKERKPKKHRSVSAGFRFAFLSSAFSLCLCVSVVNGFENGFELDFLWESNMNAQKKEMLAAYKEREVIGGVYQIRNVKNGQRFLESTTDMNGSRNRFDFSRKNGMCAHKKIESDWKKWGADSFVFEILEELTKETTRTAEAFQGDLAALKALWLEKISEERA